MHTFQIDTLIQFFNFRRLLHVSNLLGSSSVSNTPFHLPYYLHQCM